MYPDIEEVQGDDMSPQLLGWIDVADVMRAFLQREAALHLGLGLTETYQGCWWSVWRT